MSLESGQVPSAGPNTTFDSKSIRTATVSRKTAETTITCTIALDHAPGVKQVIDVSTGIGFLDHVRSSPGAEGAEGGS